MIIADSDWTRRPDDALDARNADGVAPSLTDDVRGRSGNGPATERPEATVAPQAGENAADTAADAAVDEADEESFPASDPPAWGPAHAG